MKLGVKCVGGTKGKEGVGGRYDQIILHTSTKFLKDKWKYTKKYFWSHFLHIICLPPLETDHQSTKGGFIPPCCSPSLQNGMSTE